MTFTSLWKGGQDMKSQTKHTHTKQISSTNLHTKNEYNSETHKTKQNSLSQHTHKTSTYTHHGRIPRLQTQRTRQTQHLSHTQTTCMFGS